MAIVAKLVLGCHTFYLILISSMLSNLINFVKKHFNNIILLIIVFLLILLSFAVGFIVAKYQGGEPIQFIEEHDANLQM